MLPIEALAQADRRKEILIVANETGPNSLDIHTVGANRPSYGVSWICYDRLMSFGAKKLANGQMTCDYTKLEPGLAESWQMAKDGMSVVFKLRNNAKFHDGTPVTARDVKWSLDRAVTLGGFPVFQMKAGQETVTIAGKEMPARPGMGFLTQPVSFVGLPVVVVPLGANS